MKINKTAGVSLTEHYVGTITVPATATIVTDGVRYRTSEADIDLGSVIVVVGSATPVTDPFRTYVVDSETRGFPVTSETRSTTIQSETRIIIIPTETRTIEVDDETRTYKIAIPPFVSPNIRSK